MKEVTKLKIYTFIAIIGFILLWFILRTISRGTEGTYTKFLQNPTAILITAGGFLILTIILLIFKKKNSQKDNINLKLPNNSLKQNYL